MAFRKIEAGLVHAPVDEFIGKTGTIFYDNDLGDFRISDGRTPGGIALSFGGGEGGDYTLPTASTTIKGGVKIDGTTIAITNQVIRVGTVPYSNLSGTPTIPTNTNQLTNGAGFITSSALSSYALTSAIPTNTNQLTNGAGFITSSALSGLATESYVTGRGYLTEVPEASSSVKGGVKLGLGLTKNLDGTVDAFSGSYTDLTNKPTIPTDLSQLTDLQGLLGQGGSGGNTVITNNIENPFSFSVSGDDSTLREIANGESIRFAGAGGITIITDEEGKITITGTTVDLTGYATETYVITQGYITSADLTGYALTEDIPTDNNELTNGAGYITSAALTGLATESYVDNRGYITGLSWNQLTDKPDLASTYSFNIAGTDSTLHEISSNNTIQFKGTGNIEVDTDTDGIITINIPSASVVTDDTAPTDPTTGELWWDTVSGNLYIYYDSNWVISNDFIGITDYYQLTGLPDLSVYALRSDISQAEAYSFNIAADDSTLREITNNESIKFVGAGGITTSSDADGNITITGAAQDRLTSNARSAVLNSNGTFSLPTLTATPSSPQAGQMALADGVSWDPIGQSGTSPYMVIYTGTTWIGLAGGVTIDQVYEAIFEMGA